MKNNWKRWLRPVLFALGGGLLGLGYYYLVGCAAGSCGILSNPVHTVVYMSIMGWLLSGIFGKGCENGCNM